MVLAVQGPDNDPVRLSVHSMTLHIMAQLIHDLMDRLERFERWFDRRYGWFFTNGMKERPGEE